MKLMERIASDQLPSHPQITGFNIKARPFVFIGIEEDLFACCHQSMKHRWQIGNPPHGFDSRNPLGILPGEAGPFPGGQVRAWLSEKEDLPVARFDSIGGEQQDCLNLFDTGQPEEISRRHQPKDTVSIGREDIGGMNQGEAFGRKLSRQAAAVGTKQV